MWQMSIEAENSAMFERWKQRQVARSASSLGYNRRRVDTFLAQVGADHAHGIAGHELAAVIRGASFPLAPRGYDTATIDAHLAALHDQFLGLSSGLAAA